MLPPRAESFCHDRSRRYWRAAQRQPVGPQRHRTPAPSGHGCDQQGRLFGHPLRQCSNDCRLATNPAGGYLDLSLPPDAILRADHMVFFKYGFEGTQNYLYGEGGNKQGEGPISRIYFDTATNWPGSKTARRFWSRHRLRRLSQSGGSSAHWPWMDRGLLGGNRPMIRQNMASQTGFTNAPANFSVPLPAFPADNGLCRRPCLWRTTTRVNSRDPKKMRPIRTSISEAGEPTTATAIPTPVV